MIVYLFCVLIFISYNNGDYINRKCNRQNITFDKTVGVRPGSVYVSKALYKNRNNDGLHAVTNICIQLCRTNIECEKFVIFYNVSECYEFKNNGMQRDYYINDINAVIFQKTCLTVPDNCRKRPWSIERVPGSILITNQLKMFDGLTRQECAQRCLSETTFFCRSANFKTNIERNFEMLGTCYLNEHDRHSMTNRFRATASDNEYIENKCIDILLSLKTNKCFYEERSNSVLKHIDAEFNNMTKHECQEKCENENCNSYSLIPMRDEFYSMNNCCEIKYKCLIHSEDSQLFGPRLLQTYIGAKYFESTNCINVTVLCTNKYMYIKYFPEYSFYGRMYMKGYSEHDECNKHGHGIEKMELKLNIADRQCGIIEAFSIGNHNRSLLSTYLIIQYNSLIQTQGDRLIKIGCTLDNNFDYNIHPITLGASIKFNSSDFPEHGTTIIRNSTVLPKVEMYIVDLNDENETVDVQIGQALELRIIIKPPDGPYDIWAGHLVAMSENGQDSILLLNDIGCPTNPLVFPSLVKIKTSEKNMLIAKFQAFKFTTSPIVKFNVIVHFCILSCKPIECGINTPQNLRNIEKNIDVTLSKYEQEPREKNNVELRYTNGDTMMSLEFVMIVHSQEVFPDRLIYGENNKILVAGYDVENNEICIDYYLFIGLIITWILIQIIILICCVLIIQKYKKYVNIAYDQQSLSDMHSNFGLGTDNLSRRVRWADENCPHTVID